jgi:hypothetical protein
LACYSLQPSSLWSSWQSSSDGGILKNLFWNSDSVSSRFESKLVSYYSQLLARAVSPVMRVAILQLLDWHLLLAFPPIDWNSYVSVAQLPERLSQKQGIPQISEVGIWVGEAIAEVPRLLYLAQLSTRILQINRYDKVQLMNNILF